MKKTIIVLFLALAVFAGCKNFTITTPATSAGIQGDWLLEKVSGTACAGGILEYSIEGDVGDYTIGTIYCSSNGASFDYEYDDTDSTITITGADAAGAGLLDGEYYVFIDEEEMAWELVTDSSFTAYEFSAQ